MLADAAIDEAASKLAQYQKSNDDLSDILKQYSDLIADYRSLKKECEEERQSKERYKQLVRNYERDPFVLFLIDGDNYIFNHVLNNPGEQGGADAANQLEKGICRSLEVKGIDDFALVVCVYANFLNLSKRLHKHGICGPEKRALAAFAAGFSNVFSHTNFSDVGTVNTATSPKIEDMLRLFADKPQCKHIYLAACHDENHADFLALHKNRSKKFTLVQTPSLPFHPKFRKLGLGVEEIPGLFLETPPEEAVSLATKKRLIEELSAVVVSPKTEKTDGLLPA